MTIPYNLLNSTAEIFVETNTKGAMGQPVQSLQLVTTTKARCDLRTETRDDAPIEQTAKTARVYLPGSISLTTSNWIRVTAPNGNTITGQVLSVSEPGLMGHHTAATIVARLPIPSIT
jgi:hypothetical protein